MVGMSSSIPTISSTPYVHVYILCAMSIFHPQVFEEECEGLAKCIADWDVRLATIICQNFDECTNPERAFKVRIGDWFLVVCSALVSSHY